MPQPGVNVDDGERASVHQAQASVAFALEVSVAAGADCATVDHLLDALRALSPLSADAQTREDDFDIEPRGFE